jgi:probable rRNA maturation factor
LSLRDPAALRDGRATRLAIWPVKHPAEFVKLQLRPYAIAIANRQRAVRVDRRRLIRLAKAVLAMEEVARAEISVALVDDEEIHAVNRRFLNHDCPTDVISFLFNGDGARDRKPPAAAKMDGRPSTISRKLRARQKSSRYHRRGSGKIIEGEIVISAETARRNAKTYRVTPNYELALYLVHGLLHLCGYDDGTPREKRFMRRREAEAFVAIARPRVQ